MQKLATHTHLYAHNSTYTGTKKDRFTVEWFTNLSGLEWSFEHGGVGGRDWENTIDTLTESESKEDGDEGRRDKGQGKLRCQ